MLFMFTVITHYWKIWNLPSNLKPQKKSFTIVADMNSPYVFSCQHPDESLGSFKFFQVGNISYLMIIPDRALMFPSVSYLRTMINKTGLKHSKESHPVVLNCQHISAADFTATKGFQVNSSFIHSTFLYVLVALFDKELLPPQYINMS